MEHHKPTQPKGHKNYACALLALFLWAIPSLGLAQQNTLTVSPQPSEGLITLGPLQGGVFTTSMTCGVSSNGAVSTDCSFSASASSDVRLIAVAGPAYQFLGWSGDADCSGTTAMITFTNNRNRTCTPYFVRSAYTQVAGYTRHQCAVTANGGVQCWGLGRFGQLGNGKNNASLTPVTVRGISTAIAVAVGSEHNCALLMDKTVQCWGDNSNGQLGIGTKVGTFNTPQTVIALSNVMAIDAGTSYTCAVREGGHVLCWGRDSLSTGILGLGATTQVNVPTTLSGINNAISASAGNDGHTCALLNNGRAKCWGSNNHGQLGTGNTNSTNTPKDDVTNLTTAMAISAGTTHTCALLNNGRAKCWGLNSNGQLGTGNTNNTNTPADITNLSNAVAISVSSTHTCALLSNGRIQCWGNNGNGRLGLGFNGGNATEPRSILRITTAIAMDANAVSTTCAILTDGNAYCWGTGYSNVPTAVSGQPGVPTPSAIISVYSHSPFIAVSPDRTIPATVTNNPAWLQYSASTGAFFGIPTSAASAITITAGSNPPFSVSPVTFSITIKDLPTLTSLTIEDTDARANNIPIDAAVNTPLPNPRLIVKDQSDSEVQVPLRWSLTQAAGVFRINDNTGTLALTQALTVIVTVIFNGVPTEFANVSHTITVRTDFPALIETLFQPNLPTATTSQSFVITAVPVSDPLKLHIKTFLEGPLQ